MKRLFAIGTCAVIAALVSACQASVGTGGMITVPKDAASTCAGHCADIGLTLDSVVIMAGTVGCVCRARATSAQSEGSGAAGGMAALMIEEQQRQQQRQQH